MAEKDVTSWGRAENVIKLIDKGYGVDDSVEAARDCGDLQRCLRYLTQECPLCFGKWPMSQVCAYKPCVHNLFCLGDTIFAHRLV